MKIFTGWTAFIILLTITCATQVFGKDDFEQELKAFEDKISHQKAGSTPLDQQRIQFLQTRVLSSIKVLHSALDRKDYDKARQLLSDNGYLEIPPEFQQEWQDISNKILKKIDQKKAEEMEEWRNKVDQLVTDVHAACINAKNSADLDPFLVRCAALQMQRQGRETVLGARIEEKIQGIAFTLTNWAHFLDYTAVGNQKAAIDALQNLLKNNNGFPILSKNEIEQRVSSDATLENMTASSLAPKIFDGVKTPDNLESAIRRISEFTPKSSQSPILGTLEKERQRLEILQNAWSAAKKGDADGSMNLINQLSRVPSSSDFQPYEDAIRQQIDYQVFGQKLSSLSQLDFKPDENILSMVTRALDTLQSKADYPAMIEVMNLHSKIDRSEAVFQDRASIQKYLAGQKFESIDDFLSAITEYRSSISSASGKYAPVKQATEALQRLKEKHPEAFKDYQGAVMEELRALREEIRQLPTRSSFPNGRSFPPGFPR